LAFETHSLNLVSETMNRTDIGSSVLVKDRQTGALEWVSDPEHAARQSGPTGAGMQGSAAVGARAVPKVYAVSPSMSADGRYVAFAEYLATSASDKTTNIVVYDRTAGTYQVFPRGSLSIGGGQIDGTSNTSPPLVISGDGSTIVFRIAPDAATGLFFGDIVSLNRATGQQVSIASSLVPNEAPSQCINPDGSLCTPQVPLREAAPQIMGRGISFNGRRVVVGVCCYHVYRIDQGVATRIDPVPPEIQPPDDAPPIKPSVRVGWVDMSSDGRFVVFSQVVTPNPDLSGFTTSMLVADLAGGGFRRLATMTDTSNVTWSGPFALSGDGRFVFHQLRARSGAPLLDHRTVRQLMVVRDATTGALVRDPNTGTTEVVTANVKGVALRCGIEDTDVRLVTNSDGRMLAYADRDYTDTYQVVPWDRNQLSDVYVVDRSVPIQAAIHIEAPCTDFDLGPIIPAPH
jgi:hypothetical protein